MASVQRYADRRVLITGGGSGIGQACVLRILGEGGRVAAADISRSGSTTRWRRLVRIAPGCIPSWWTSATRSRSYPVWARR